MTPEQVTSHLKEVIEEVTEHIPKEFFEKNLFFAGGAVRSLANKESPKDYDVFVRNPEALAELVTLLEGKYLYKSINAIALKTTSGKEVQFILMTTGSPEEVIGEFDFLMNMNYYVPSTDHPTVNWAAYDKKLRINPKARNILGTLARIPKFVARGFEFPDANDMVTLGIRASKMEPVTKTSQLVAHCRLASCVSQTVIFNNQLEEDIDLSTIAVALRGSNA